MIAQLAAIAAVSATMSAPPNNPVNGTVNVRQYGAKGDGTGDDTAAFQAAMAALGKEGGTVEAPRGTYRFAGHLEMPANITIAGAWQSVPAHNGVRDKGFPKPGDDGTTFLITENAGKEDGAPFITLNTNCTLKGVLLYYPDQKPDTEPTPYPWAIAMRGKNPAVTDVEMLNPYNGIDASQNERHLIRNVQGQPIRRGVYIDSIYDIGRLENIHFNPWWSMTPTLYDWQMAHGEAFIFGRTDWQYVLNTFCFGYKVGYHFMETKTGSTNGNFLGIGADDCWNAVLVDQSAPFGILITNGEFTSFHGPNPIEVLVTESHSGSVRFVNCAFWGPCSQIASISGRGTVGFSDCTFVQWDLQAKDGRPAIIANNGSVLIRGCEFRDNKAQIELGPGVKRAVITGNIMHGPVKISNKSAGSVKINDNAGD